MNKELSIDKTTEQRAIEVAAGCYVSDGNMACFLYAHSEAEYELLVRAAVGSSGSDI